MIGDTHPGSNPAESLRFWGQPRNSSFRSLLCALAMALPACGDDDDDDAGTGEHVLEWRVALEDLDGAILSLWGPSISDLFAVGGSLGADGGQAIILWSDGQAWHEQDAGDAPTLWWVFGLAHDAVWAVGERGTILRFDGDEWSTVATGADYTLWGVWGANESDLWAVGGSAIVDAPPVILRWDGSGWEPMAPPTGDERGLYFKVWGASADDVYIVGAGGAILHWDGEELSLMESPSTDRLVTVVGRGPGDVWAVGGLGMPVALHLADGAWAAVTDPAFVEGLMGVWTAPDQLVVVSGFRGYLAVGDEGGFTEQASPTDLCLHGVWGDAKGNFAAGGGDLLLPAPPKGTIVAVGAVPDGPVE
ncbi:MAG: hypothetical protein HYY06_07800 [Deltaproteobacteria bacterium]|nr:hypothetical protein [Deltaproteobacteria bacterium]